MTSPTEPLARQSFEAQHEDFQTVVVRARGRRRKVQRQRGRRRGAYAAQLERGGRPILRRLRVERGLTQHELALLARVSEKLVRYIECGTCRPRSSDDRKRIALALGLTLDGFEKLLNLPLECSDREAAA